MVISVVRGLRRRWLLRRDPVQYARWLGVRVGDDRRFIGVSSATFGSEPYLVSIGDHVTITAGVRFVTHGGGVWVFRERYPDIDVIKPISVGRNVFIGLNSIILPGVTIGRDCVVGAGSVVTRDAPSGVVVAGCPARVIKSVDEYEDSVLAEASFVKRSGPEAKRAWLVRRWRVEHE